ncbi:restriction endonuclease subunit S [Shewanella sp. SM103]|uniref:restriction endonuclease subunit S n=2 Tax=unclassified Shewanella TaxID=196818 RepID=UPI0021DB25C2|nr:restriction endonuclease subunit S [Shewanella sp. SM103]MCU8080507.1 restriction endonuclease subunit S [Shewanella sp. SM103]
MSWPMVKLGDVAEKVDYGLTASAVEKTDGPRFLRITDLQNDSVDWSTVPSSKCSPKEFEDNKLAVGDIVFARTGATTGKSFLIRSLPKPSVFASYLIRVRPGKSVDPSYLSHFFKSPMYWNQISVMANGAAQPGVNSSKLKELEIPLPPLDEQKSIAAILDKADAIRRKRKQAIQLADDFLRSVFLDMFGDPFTNPKGWEVKAIKDLATVTTGNTPSRKVPEYFGNDVEWIKSDNINTPHHILTTATEYLSHEGVKVARTVPKGSTLITCIAGSFDCIGNAAFTDREVSFNQQINALTPKDGVLSWFLYALIIFSKKIIQNASTNSMKGMISKGKLEEVKLFLPPLDLQRQFEDILDKQTRTVERMNSSNESEHELFNSLSQKAFAGEL